MDNRREDRGVSAVHGRLMAVRAPVEDLKTTVGHSTAAPNRPTMRDVARASGVSLKTVSRVLNAEPGVVDGTARRVERAVAELGFTRNDIAAGLRRRGQATGTLGLVIEDLSNPFYSTLARAVEELARERGLFLLTGSSAEDPDRERALVQAFCARRVDGLIIVPTAEDHSFLSTEMSMGTAIVFVDRLPLNLDADSVVTANAEGTREGVDHLIAHGHHDIAYIGDDAAISTATQRLTGYRESLSAHGIPVDPTFVRLGAHTSEAAERAVIDLLSKRTPPSAIFTGNNLLTVGAHRALRAQQRRIALVGFDDFDLADLLDPPVTVVAQDATALGRTAAQMIFGRLADPTVPPRVVALPTKLVIRGSGEIHPQ